MTHIFRHLLIHCAVLSLSSMAPAFAHSQTELQRLGPLSRGPVDGDVEPPAAQALPGRKDETALRVLQRCASTEGIKSDEIVLEKGTMSLASPKEGTRTTARLRLDAKGAMDLSVDQENHGYRLRTNGGTKMLIQQWGERDSLVDTPIGSHPNTCTSLVAKSQEDVAMIDDGTTNLDGNWLQKVTITEFVVQTSKVSRPFASTFFFDTNTGRMIKSAALTYEKPGQTPHPLAVITYSDYRNVEGHSLPYSISESFSGQRGQTFAATDVSISSKNGGTDGSI